MQNRANLDQVLLSVSPILPVPRHGDPLEQLTASGHRYLVAKDGLWLELSRPWLHIVTRIAANEYGVGIPVGELKETMAIRQQVPPELLRQFAQAARARSREERAALITFNSDTGTFSLRDVIVLDNSAGHINYRYPPLANSEEVVLDIHTHARGKAFFSTTDNNDDKREVKFSLVLGHCDQEELSVAFRLCLLGKFIEMPFPHGVLQ